MANTLRYNPEYHPDWAWSLYARGATDEEVADAFKVKRRTILRWADTYPEFREARLESKDIADAKVEKSLYKRATGFKYETVETVLEYDNQGQPRPAKVQRYEHYAPPETGAICFWLKNRKPDKWKDRNIQAPEIDVFKDMDKLVVKIQEAAEDAGNNTVEKTS